MKFSTTGQIYLHPLPGAHAYAFILDKVPLLGFTSFHEISLLFISEYKHPRVECLVLKLQQRTFLSRTMPI